MMKTIIILSVVLLAVSLAFAETYVGVININNDTVNSKCTEGNGKIETEKRSLDSFEKIEISGALDVTIVHGTNYEAVVEVDSNIIPKIASRVQGNTLYLGPENAHICVKNPIKVTLTAPAINSIYVDGANDVNMDWAPDYGNLSLQLAGSSDFKLIGHGQSLTAVLEGAAGLDATNGTAQVVNVNAGGSSTAIVSAQQDLVATSTDASDIYYTGPFSRKQISVHDASDILPLSEK